MVLLFVHIVYGTTYRNNPKNPKKAASEVVKAKLPTPKTAMIIASHSVILKLTSPVTVGLTLVLSIIISISRSYKLLNAPAAAMINAVPIVAKIISGILSIRPKSYVYIANVKPANIGTRLDFTIPILTV